MPRRVLFFTEDQLQLTARVKIKTVDLRNLVNLMLADEVAAAQAGRHM